MAKTRVWGRWTATEDSFDKGGQGQVYFVHDSTGKFEGEFVLKQLINPKRLARFETEIAAIARLSGHPHVIDLVDHGAFRDADKPTYVMRKADMALDRYLVERNPSTLDRLAMFDQILSGIEHIHASQIIHRDIKPENILVIGDRPVISDFGLCLIQEADMRNTPSWEVVGPRYYMAPELADGRNLEVTTKADVYSLGKLLYFMLSRGKVFDREKTFQRGFNLRDLRDERYRIFEGVFRRSIAESVRERFDTAGAFRSDLQRARDTYASHGLTTAEGKIPNLLDSLTSDVEQLVGLSTAEWFELLKEREKRKSSYSEALLKALESALHEYLAGSAAREVLRQKADLSEEQLIQWSARIVLLGGVGANGYDAIGAFWDEIYQLALKDSDSRIPNLVGRNINLPSATVLEALACRSGELSTSARKNLVTWALLRSFPARESFLLKASHGPISSETVGVAIAGLADIGSDAAVKRIVEVLRNCTSVEGAEGVFQAIAMKGKPNTLEKIVQAGGYVELVARVLETLVDLSQRARADKERASQQHEDEE